MRTILRVRFHVLRSNAVALTLTYDHASTESSQLAPTTILSHVLDSPNPPTGFSSLATCSFRIAVPDEWYRRTRSKSRHRSSLSLTPSEHTIRALQDLTEEDEDEEATNGPRAQSEESESETEGDGTARQKDLSPPPSTSGAAGGKGGRPDWRSSISQNRISTMLEGWLRPSTPTNEPHQSDATPTTPPSNRMSVSEPVLLSQNGAKRVVQGHGNGNGNGSEASGDEEDEFDSEEFARMVVCICLFMTALEARSNVVIQNDLGLKGPQREAMYALPLDRKKYLLLQHQQFRSSTSPPSTPNKSSNFSATYGPSSAPALIPRLVPQLTGDSGLMKRFSISGWGGGAATPSTSSATAATATGRSSGEFAAVDGQGANGVNGSSSSKKLRSQVDKVVEETASPLQAQTTGGLWSSWWSSSGGEKASTLSSSRSNSISGLIPSSPSAPNHSHSNSNPSTSKTPSAYITALKSHKPTDSKMVKHLISLRVHLSTANLAWIGEFVDERVCCLWEAPCREYAICVMIVGEWRTVLNPA